MNLTIRQTTTELISESVFCFIIGDGHQNLRFRDYKKSLYQESIVPNLYNETKYIFQTFKIELKELT